jgi:hypothetical protein
MEKKVAAGRSSGIRVNARRAAVLRLPALQGKAHAGDQRRCPMGRRNRAAFIRAIPMYRPITLRY